MSLKRHAYIEITCDSCDESLESDDGGIMHFESEGHAEGEARDCDWRIADGKHYCERCVWETKKAPAEVLEAAQRDHEEFMARAYQGGVAR